eukprot:TRINITY_DN15061_c0_g1_i1.p1 TRINITY_DN15061_c0_g1~~TRINITY_DN15061_c0_g1_i1.p1  ORF type:complete len:366 (+),score=108.63 TRINITY_DN15061_c0_g1_i1:89-1099(+)
MRTSCFAGLVALLLAGHTEADLSCLSGACPEQEVERAEEQDASELQVTLLQSGRLLQRARSQDRPVVNMTKEDMFAWDQVTKAVMINEVKERLDLGDVKEQLLAELNKWQKQCPDADEIQFQLGDLWADVLRVVRAQGLEDGMEQQKRNIEQADQTVKRDAAASAARLKQLEKDYAAATANFTADQLSRISDIVETREHMSDVKKSEMAEKLTAEDRQAIQDKALQLEKKYAELTKDFNDVQLQQAIAAVAVKKDLESVRKTLSSDYQDGETKARTEVPKSKLDDLKKEYEAATQSLDIAGVKKKVMEIWLRSLYDLPDMEDVRKSWEARLSFPGR